MSAQAIPSLQAPDGVAEDFARPALEHQMAALGRLADVGLEIVEGLAAIVARQLAAAEPAPSFDVPAINLAFDRTARAVRLSFALQSAVIDQLRGVGRIEKDEAEKAQRVRNAEVEARQAQAQAAADTPAKARKAQINQVLTGILSDAHGDDAEGYDRHFREARERLRDHEVLDNVLGRPASEIIADICRLLGLDPNWEGLAFEAWALEERQSGKVGAPLRSPPPWTGKRPGIRGALLAAEAPPTELPPPPVHEDLSASVEPEDAQDHLTEETEIEIAQAPPPYIPPPDPDILPGYPVGLPGEYPPPRPGGRRPRPMAPPTNYTRGFI